MQPPWSTATSMMTDPAFIVATMSSVTSLGVRTRDQHGAHQQRGAYGLGDLVAVGHAFKATADILK